MLVSAACHPSYSTLDPQLPPDGGCWTCTATASGTSRPSTARMQAFRMHEYVRVGTPEQASSTREKWIGHGLAMLAELGLDAAPSLPTTRSSAAPADAGGNQHAENLKTELVIRLYGDLTDGTAVVSSNCHQDHFGTTFALRTADGEVAHSACVGFGMERIALALFRTHGLDPATWLISVRAAMTA